MLDKELLNIWKNSSKTEQIKFDISRLMIDLKNNLTRTENKIQRRDRIESIAAIIGIFVFGYFAYEIPYPITKFACILAIAWFVFVIYKLRSVQKHKLPLDTILSFREQLKAQKSYLLKQAHLLDSVLYWYVLPPFIMNLIFIIGVDGSTQDSTSSGLLSYLPHSSHDKITTIITLILFYAFVFWLNRSASKRNLRPIIADIERLENVQQQLEKED